MYKHFNGRNYNISSPIWPFQLVAYIIFSSVNLYCCSIIFYRITMSLDYIQEILVTGEPGKLMTINKSQGQTISHVGMFLPKPIFSHAWATLRRHI